MKKRIAIVANGWYNKGINGIVKGVQRYTESKGIDIFVFLTYSQFKENLEYNQGEFNIHRLPDYHSFDGVIFIPGTLSSIEEANRLHEYFVSEKIPVVTIGEHLDGLSFVSSEDYESMCMMCEHLVEKHDIKSVAIMAGHIDHDESNARIRGTVDTFAKYGVEIKPEEIFYCDWQYAVVKDATRKLINKRRGVPDAIICANDVAAMAACITLEEEGYSVPEDVIVTGYDNTDVGRAFYPSITTMAQPYDSMGYGCAEIIYEMIESGTISERSYICNLVLGESCGCEDGKESAIARRMLAKSNCVESEENILFEYGISDVENTFFKASKFEELSDVLLRHYKNFHKYVSDGFAIVLSHTYKQNIYSKNIDLKTEGFPKNMEVLVGIDGDDTFRIDNFNPKDLVPRFANDGKPHTYIFCSLHSRDNIFGYLVFRDTLTHLETRTLHTYEKRLGELFEKYRKNMRLNSVNEELMELSVKDELTGIFNRLGYERIVKPYYENNVLLGKKNAIIFIDINRMKYINDTFGHLQGDMAIRLVATVILACIPGKWHAVRYGGDEFIIVGDCNDEQDVIYLCERIGSTVTKRGEQLSLPYKMSASCGYIITDPTSEKGLEEYVIMADEYMYKNKKRTYEEGTEE